MTASGKMVYVIAGPTASGKTDLSLKLARFLDTAIISADSRQCYRETTIGTAKPSLSVRAEIPHYFIDQFPITQDITAADFEKLALGYLHDIFQYKDAAIVCGGTGLYIKALCEGLDTMPAVKNEIVQEVNRTYKERGIQWLQETVLKEDPLFAAQGEMQNPARMIRALVFIRSTGSSITTYKTGTKKKRDFHVVKFAPTISREKLYERINLRVDNMINQGLVEEAQKLYPYRHLKNLQTVGYTELFEHLDGKYDLETAIEKIKQHTRNYAKRQLTWFRKDKEIEWIDFEAPDVLKRIFT